MKAKFCIILLGNTLLTQYVLFTYIQILHNGGARLCIFVCLCVCANMRTRTRT